MGNSIIYTILSSHYHAELKSICRHTIFKKCSNYRLNRSDGAKRNPSYTVNSGKIYQANGDDLIIGQ